MMGLGELLSSLLQLSNFLHSKSARAYILIGGMREPLGFVETLVLKVHQGISIF